MLGVSAVGCQEVGGSELRFAWCKIGSYCQPMNTIKSFFAKISQQFFRWRVNWEIFHRISPHLRNECNHGYSFRSKDEMVRLHVRGNLHAGLNLRLIERTAAKMPKFQGDALRYIAYRDLNERMEMYLALAEESIQSETCDPCFIATQA